MGASNMVDENRRHGGPYPIGDCLRRIIMGSPVFRAHHTLLRLREIWLEENNEYFRRATEDFTLRRGTLTIRISNDALRMELNAQRDQIRDTLNAQMGQEVVQELRFR